MQLQSDAAEKHSCRYLQKIKILHHNVQYPFQIKLSLSRQLYRGDLNQMDVLCFQNIGLSPNNLAFSKFQTLPRRLLL